MRFIDTYITELSTTQRLVFAVCKITLTSLVPRLLVGGEKKSLVSTVCACM